MAKLGPKGCQITVRVLYQNAVIASFWPLNKYGRIYLTLEVWHNMERRHQTIVFIQSSIDTEQQRLPLNTIQLPVPEPTTPRLSVIPRHQFVNGPLDFGPGFGSASLRRL